MPLPALDLAGCCGMDRQRVHAVAQLVHKCGIDHAMAVEPALPPEGFRYDMNPEMGLAARPVSGMAFVLVGLVDHREALRRKGCGKLLFDRFFDAH